MPRKPIGDRAMTAAERQRRHRAKDVTNRSRNRSAGQLSRRALDVTKAEPVTKPAEPSAELIEARKKIDQLRSENSVLRLLLAQHEGRQAETAAKQAAARKAKKAAADAAAAEGYANDNREALLEKLVQANKQSTASKTRIKNLEAAIEHWRRVVQSKPRMSRQLYRRVRGYLHPDRAHNDEDQRRKLEKCFQEFCAIEFTFPPKEETE